jgi:hypothetical protein
MDRKIKCQQIFDNLKLSCEIYYTVQSSDVAQIDDVLTLEALSCSC